jgi:hypothetical protein
MARFAPGSTVRVLLKVGDSPTFNLGDLTADENGSLDFGRLELSPVLAFMGEDEEGRFFSAHGGLGGDVVLDGSQVSGGAPAPPGRVETDGEEVFVAGEDPSAMAAEGPEAPEPDLAAYGDVPTGELRAALRRDGFSVPDLGVPGEEEEEVG